MTLETNELFKSNTQAQGKRLFPRRALVKTLAAQVGAIAEGNAVYQPGTVLAYNESTTFLDLWRPAVLTNEEFSVTANATPATDGTFTLTVFGETTAAIDHDASAATIEAALVALGQIDVGDVSVTTFGSGLGTGSGGVTIEFTGQYAGTVVVLTANFSGLTGNTHVLANEADAATTAPDGLNVIRFILLEKKAVSETEEVHVVVMNEGEFHVDDLVLLDNSGSGGVNQGSTSGLNGALQNPATRSPLLVVKGLAGVG